jgi:LemA protein
MNVYFIMGGFILLLIVTIIGIYSYNTLSNCKLRLDTTFNELDEVLIKRWNIIPNVIDSLRQSVGAEDALVKELMELRNALYDSLANDEKITANTRLTMDIDRVVLLTTSNVNVKNNQTLLICLQNIMSLATEIGKKRRYYNLAVVAYNKSVEGFPTKILAKILKYNVERVYEPDRDEKFEMPKEEPVVKPKKETKPVKQEKPKEEVESLEELAPPTSQPVQQENVQPQAAQTQAAQQVPPAPSELQEQIITLNPKE